MKDGPKPRKCIKEVQRQRKKSKKKSKINTEANNKLETTEMATEVEATTIIIETIEMMTEMTETIEMTTETEEVKESNNTKRKKLEVAAAMATVAEKTEMVQKIMIRKETTKSLRLSKKLLLWMTIIWVIF